MEIAVYIVRQMKGEGDSDNFEAVAITLISTRGWDFPH